jgi:large subunit ribosomal protein L3
MAGRLGNKVTTITNSEVLLIDIDENILVLKGSVPGKRKNMLKITPKI